MHPAATLAPPAATDRSTRRWRRWQVASAGAAAVVLAALAVAPERGLDLLWNLWVPLLPALLAVSPGTWRNLCPLAAVALFREGRRRVRPPRMSPRAQDLCALASLLGLVAVVPLRHVWFDRGGLSTLVLLVALGALAFAVGGRSLAKSGWCAGACPLHLAERLYGLRPGGAVTHRHCLPCTGCVAPCPDLARAGATAHQDRRLRRVLDQALAAAFPGFIAGWFRVADATGPVGPAEVLHAYTMPLMGAVVSAVAYLALRQVLGPRRREWLPRAAAAAALSLYYWHRLPALLGFGLVPGDGALVDLRGVLSPLVPAALQVGAAAFFVWWMLVRRAPASPWSVPVSPSLAPAPARSPPSPAVSAAVRAPLTRKERSHASLPH